MAEYIGDSIWSRKERPHAIARYAVATERSGFMTTKAKTFMLRAKQRHTSGVKPLSSTSAQDAVAYHIGELKTKMRMGEADSRSTFDYPSLVQSQPFRSIISMGWIPLTIYQEMEGAS